MIDFSTLLSAVKQKDRTDRYVILSGLYSLDGFDNSVTTKSLSDVLELNLGSKAPTHLSTRLREYSAYVRVADKGPPLRWRLTTAGLEFLRKASGMDLQSHAANEDFMTDVGIVCALHQPELDAVMIAGGGASNWREVSTPRYAHIYRAARIVSLGGKSLSVIATTATSMGLTASAVVTTQLVLQFRPRIVVMVGIAAGTREGGKQFGDVLVADPSVDYNSGKVADVNGVREFLPDPYPIGLNPRVRTVLQKYRGNNKVFDEIRSDWSGTIPELPNRLHLGPVGAADQVIDDPRRVMEIQRNWRKLIGMEMETYGVYRACHEAPDPKPRFVSFKAVCDFAEQKGDTWQEYAAFTAAQFTFRFLKTEWEAMWPQTGARQS